MAKGNPKFMRLALREAYKGIHGAEGGPFGAAIVKNGKVIGSGHNRVLKGRNPTLHAEVCALDVACRKLKTHLLEGCEIYSTTEPCVMCFAAINWAKIDTIYFGTAVPDVARLGFNELTISNKTLKRLGKSPAKIVSGFMRKECLKLLKSWKGLPSARTY